MSADFPEPWSQPDERDRAPLAEEVLREVAVEGHPLSGHAVAVVARCGGCDELLVRVDEDAFALVHPTWSGRRESPPWPNTVPTGGFLATEAAVVAHAVNHG